MGTDGFAAQDGGDPALWDDATARRELTLLTRLGLVGAFTAVFAVPYVLLDGARRLPDLIFVMTIVDVAMFCSLGAVFVFGFFATLRRRLFGWMFVGFVLGPFAYAVWAALTLRRLPPMPKRSDPQAETTSRERRHVARHWNLGPVALVVVSLLCGLAFVVACFLYQSAGHPEAAGTACFVVSIVAIVLAIVVGKRARGVDRDRRRHAAHGQSYRSYPVAALSIWLFAVAPGLTWLILALR